MREREIEKALVAAVRKRDGLALKFVSPGLSGVPDRVVMFESGRLAFIETKRPGGRLRILQKKRKAQFEKLGFKVFCLDNKNEIEVILDAIQSA